MFRQLAKKSQLFGQHYSPPHSHKETYMATNTGKGHRKGAVKERSQFYNEKTGKWNKRDKETGEILDVKQDGEPFKGIAKENGNN